MASSPTYETLCEASDRELERWMTQGEMPRIEDLAGWEFRGYNAQPVTSLLGFRKFKKGFTLDAGEPGLLRGYNVKVRQNGLLNPWVDLLRHGEPVRHGLYVAYPVDPASRDNLYPRSLLLDYGGRRNPPLDPSGLLRDYLVQVTAGDPDLYLGKAYGALGARLRIPAGYFILGRLHRVP